MSITTSAQAFSLELKPKDRVIPDLPNRERPRTLPKTDAEWAALTGSVSPKTHPDPFADPEDREVYGLSPPPKYAEGVEPRKMDVIVIGCGLSGMIISMKSRWELKNVNLRIFEKNPSYAGTWFENRYPGCRCDVPSVNYSFRFEPFDWTEGYAQWDEIWQYFRYVFHKYNVGEHVEFNCAGVGNTWDEARGKWIVEIERGTGDNKRITVEECDVIISAQGILNRPKMPDIPGLETFKGHLVHSSQWNHKTDIPDGKRVGLIGNGSTGIQIAADIAPKVARLDHFCRTPTWVAPYGMGFTVTKEYRDKMLDLATHRNNSRQSWIRGEKTWVWWTRPNWHKDAERYQRTLLGVAQRNLEASVKDPVLKAKLTPDHGWGCRRPIMSNDYYKAIQMPTSNYINEPIVRVTPKGILIKRADGTEEERELDMIICASGFAVNWISKYMPVRGRGGKLLADTWKTHPEAYRSVMVHGYPNYFWVAGPNTPPTHNSLYILFEQQINYAFQCIVFLQTNPMIKSVEVKLSAQKEFADAAQEWLGKYTQWNVDCGGWYRYKNGYIVQWPGSATHMMESLYTPNWDHMDFTFRFSHDVAGPSTPMSATGWRDRWRHHRNQTDEKMEPTILGARL